MIYFLIPVYNEEKNIPQLAENLQSVIPSQNKHYVLVNDCSTDNTIQAINQHFANTSFTLLNNPQNSGPGFSFNSGFEFIINHSKNNDDKIVTLEGDNTSDLSILNQMITNSNLGFSLVLASVYAQGGGFDQTSLFRKAISFVANMIFRALFNLKVLTMSSFYRVYHISLIKNIKANFKHIITEKGFICMLEILLKSIKVNAKIIEVPMVLKSDKRIGKSKMKIFKTTLSYIKFLVKNYNALKA